MYELTTTENFSEADFQNGSILLVDKPKDWTSFDVVNKIRWAIRKKLQIKKIKVGHSGTLDPMATGLLVICTGKFTKLLNELQGLDKVYTGTLKLGATTPSYDAETVVNENYPIDHIHEQMMLKTAQSFVGEIEQIPPMYSAIKVDGQALYKMARKGKTIERKARKITIKSFEISAIEMPEVHFKVACSTGTYIRTLAYDFGHQLQSGAYLTALKRTEVGDFNLKNAWNLDKLINSINA